MSLLKKKQLLWCNCIVFDKLSNYLKILHRKECSGFALQGQRGGQEDRRGGDQQGGVQDRQGGGGGGRCLGPRRHLPVPHLPLRRRQGGGTGRIPKTNQVLCRGGT